MKKIMAWMFFLGLAAVLLALPAHAEKAKTGFIGISAGSGPVAMSYNGYWFDGEIGIKVTEHVSFLGEVSYGSTKNTNDYNSLYSTSHEEIKFSSVPISLTLLYTVPIGGKFFPYAGIGIAYYPLKIKDSLVDTYSDYYYGTSYSYSSSKSYNVSAVAPVFKLGIEFEISSAMRIIAEIKQSSAKGKLKDTSSYGDTSETSVDLGGAKVKVGFRFYF
jgi:opacity protein-like surface antigen